MPGKTGCVQGFCLVSGLYIQNISSYGLEGKETVSLHGSFKDAIVFTDGSMKIKKQKYIILIFSHTTFCEL